VVWDGFKICRCGQEWIKLLPVQDSKAGFPKFSRHGLHFSIRKSSRDAFIVTSVCRFWLKLSVIYHHNKLSVHISLCATLILNMPFLTNLVPQNVWKYGNYQLHSFISSINVNLTLSEAEMP